MKWSSLEASPGQYTYDIADSQVGLAVCSKMRVRGHNLVWATGQQTPAYATGDGTNSAANQAVVRANIQEHIQSTVQHFGDKVYAWDGSTHLQARSCSSTTTARPMRTGWRAW